MAAYRWLHGVEEGEKLCNPPANRTPEGLAALVLEMAGANPQWGRFRIAAQLALLRVFISASAVRNILLRPAPRKPGAKTAPSPHGAEPGKAERFPRIPAWYPNHVWSVDLTAILRWGIWPVYILVAIDHFSRKIVAVRPLEGPNSGWVVDAMEEAFAAHGEPKHIITDQGVQFKSGAFEELIASKGIKQRFGAVGKHGSIAVTERAIETLKYEWLRRVPLIRGLDHLERLCEDFAVWYNRLRPHSSIGGSTPDGVYRSRPFNPPGKTCKTVPEGIRKLVFKDSRVTAYSLEDCA